MTGVCGSLDPETWVLGLISAADCQAGLIGTGGWQGLTGSAMFNILLTGLLTLAMARLGYRLMAGQVVAADIVTLLVHIGIVITLATSWQAYDRLIFRVAMNGPSEIASAFFPAAGIDASNLSLRLQNAYDAISEPPEPVGAPLVEGPGLAGSAPMIDPSGAEAMPVAESLAMTDRRKAADIMVISGAGSWVAVRLSLAVLLALGPLAFVASLFPMTAGLCVGWFRAVLGAALASIAMPLAISLELQMLEEPVRAAMRDNDPQIAGLNAIVWSFCLVIFALLFALQRLAAGLSLPMPQHLVRRDEGCSAPPMFGAAETAAADSHTRHLRIRPASGQLVIPSRTEGIVRAMETRSRSAGRATLLTDAPRHLLQAASIAGVRTIRRGSQIADGARRAADERIRTIPQRPEAQS